MKIFHERQFIEIRNYKNIQLLTRCTLYLLYVIRTRYNKLISTLEQLRIITLVYRKHVCTCQRTEKQQKKFDFFMDLTL